MLLYHFPLISDYRNLGFAELYDANGNATSLTSLTTGFVSGGKVASNAKGTTTALGTSLWDKIYSSYSIAIRAYRGNDANGVFGHIIVLNSGLSGKQDLNVRFLSGNLKIGYYNSQSSTVVHEIDVPVTVGWHDIVLNFNSGTLRCYLDASFLGSIENITYNRVPRFFGNNFIGSSISTATLIQDVRIYDRELSQAEINEYSRALVVHYPLQGNELDSSVLKDVSGFGDDYTSDSAITYGYNSPRNKYGVVTKDLLLKKGNLVNIKQLVENYDFHDGFNKWGVNDNLVLGESVTLTEEGANIKVDTPDANKQYLLSPDVAIPYNHNTFVSYKVKRAESGGNSCSFAYMSYPNINNYSFFGGGWYQQTTTSMRRYARSQSSMTQIYGAPTNRLSFLSRNNSPINNTLGGINIFDLTEIFGTDIPSTPTEIYQMLGLVENELATYGDHVVKDTRKTIPQTLSFWVEYNSTWYHLAYNGDKYVNGAVNTALFDIIYASLESGIKMTDFRVYATALSAQDIKNLYNSPITLDNKHNTSAFEFVEGNDGFSANKNGLVKHNELNEAIVYPSKYWRTPTYAEWYYILNSRGSGKNFYGRVEVSDEEYISGSFVIPDIWEQPSDINISITFNNYTTNTYTPAQLKKLEDAGIIFFPISGYRNDISYVTTDGQYWTSTQMNTSNSYRYAFWVGYNNVSDSMKRYGRAIRLAYSTSAVNKSFKTSANTYIQFAKSSLQYHCTQHIWRFAQHSYDRIGAANSNISDSYDGWIDLFGYGTSGVTYSPTLHSTDNSKYASGDITNTDNDWGINEIQSYEYNQQLYGIYKDKILTNELIEQ